MKQLNINERIDLNKVDFLTATAFLRRCNQKTIHGVQWAELYVSDKGRVVVVYKSGDQIKKRGAQGETEVIEWFDKIPGVRRDGSMTGQWENKSRRSFLVDVDKLMKHGGARREAERARLTINRVYDAAGGGYDLFYQRLVALQD